MNIYTKSLFLLAFLATLISGCQVLNLDLGNGKEVDSATDYAFVQSEVTTLVNTFDLTAQAFNNLRNDGKVEGVLGECSLTTVERNSDGTAQMIIDFGTEGCECIDGKTRKGQLYGTFDATWDRDGVTLELHGENYSVTGVNGNTYEASFRQTIQKNGIRDEMPVLNISVESLTLAIDSATSISWTETRRVTMTEGFGDLDLTNDVFEIQTEGEGVASNEAVFTVATESPLKLVADCNNVVSGIITMTPEGKKARTIDYGDGTCDNKASVAIGGFSTEIELW